MTTVFVVLYGCSDLPGESVNAVCGDAELAHRHAKECAEAQAEQMTEMDERKFEVHERILDDGNTSFEVRANDDEFNVTDWYTVSSHPLLVV